MFIAQEWACLVAIMAAAGLFIAGFGMAIVTLPAVRGIFHEDNELEVVREIMQRTIGLTGLLLLTAGAGTYLAAGENLDIRLGLFLLAALAWLGFALISYRVTSRAMAVRNNGRARRVARRSPLWLIAAGSAMVLAAVHTFGSMVG